MFIQELVEWNDFSDETLRFLRTIGVDGVSLCLREMPPDPVEPFLAAARDKVAGHGMKLHSVFMAGGWNEVKLGLPGRDARLEAWRAMIAAMGALGIPVVCYNFKLLESKFLRSAPTAGRGGARYASYDHGEFLKHPPAPQHPPISSDEMLRHLEYFLAGVLPAAEAAGVTLALHPDDPPIAPSYGTSLTGVGHITSTLEQFREIFARSRSASNGMLFCQGCVKEMGEDVYAAIRSMGEAGRIVVVHFRNVRGAMPRFQETFIDEGDVDMYRAMCAYRDVGFRGPFMMDHCPSFEHDRWAGRAFAVGYIRALIQAVYR